MNISYKTVLNQLIKSYKDEAPTVDEIENSILDAGYHAEMFFGEEGRVAFNEIFSPFEYQEIAEKMCKEIVEANSPREY